MIYEYQCPKCHAVTDVHKPMSQYDTEEKCPGCVDEVMFKLFSAPLFHGEKAFDAKWEPAFGKVIHNKREQKNTIAALNDKNNMRIEEVGTDNLSSIKKKRKEYTRDW